MPVMKYSERSEDWTKRASQAADEGDFSGALALVKEVVTRHGGRVWVESVIGKGSTFYITLPLSPPV